MFLFKKHKKLSHKQTATVGFVLAVMSILVTAVTVYVFPLLTAWLYTRGVYSLDMFLLVFVMTMYFSLQALILFGFPLFYAQDKKCHMTGFRILLCALGFELVIVLLVAVLTAMIAGQSMESYTIGDFDLDAIESVETVEVE